jgi:hypothetical protein
LFEEDQIMDTQQFVSSPPGTTEGPDYPPELADRVEEIRQDPETIPSQVESAYVPSGIAPPGSTLRVIAGAVLGIPLGYLAAAVWGAILVLLSKIGLGRICYGQLLLLAMTLAFPFVPAAVVGGMVGVGAKWGKSRKPSQVGWTAVAASFMGNVVPVAVLAGMGMADNKSVQRAIGGQISEQGILIGAGLLAVFALVSLFLAHGVAKNTVEKRKFCEECQEYMTSRQLYAVPLEETGRAVLHLLDWNLTELSQIPKAAGNAESRCEMDLWTCDCHRTNYLELNTYGKIDKKDYGGRLVYSACLDPEQAVFLGSALGAEPFVN